MHKWRRTDLTHTLVEPCVSGEGRLRAPLSKKEKAPLFLFYSLGHKASHRPLPKTTRDHVCLQALQLVTYFLEHTLTSRLAEH